MVRVVNQSACSNNDGVWITSGRKFFDQKYKAYFDNFFNAIGDWYLHFHFSQSCLLNTKKLTGLRMSSTILSMSVLWVIGLALSGIYYSILKEPFRGSPSCGLISETLYSLSLLIRYLLYMLINDLANRGNSHAFPKAGYIPIPRVEFTDQSWDFVVENMALSGQNLFPKCVWTLFMDFES